MAIAQIGGEGEEEGLARLIQSAGEGDPHALGELSERYRGQITRWAGQVLGDPDEAEDVAQGILSGLVRRLARFEGRSRFATWLYRVTRNAAIDRQRKEARRLALRSMAAAQLGGPTGLPHDEPTAIDLVEVIRTFDHELTVREREVFRLVDLEGLETGVVARRLGVAPSTVRVLLARGRATLRAKMLEQHGDLVREAGYEV
jgi:RNA polymerase sigma-70 factor (ECF subfamily)